MRRLSIWISEPAFSVLADLAGRERRDVRDQAAITLERALGAAEFDPDHGDGRDVRDGAVKGVAP